MTIKFDRNSVVLSPGDSGQIWTGVGRITCCEVANPNSFGVVELIIYGGTDSTFPIVVDIVAKPFDTEGIQIFGAADETGTLQTTVGFFATLNSVTTRGHALIILS